MAYTYQAPKDLEAQSAAFKRQYPTLEALYATQQYEVQPKYDGVFSAVYTGRHALSRQGELQLSAAHIVEELASLLPGKELVVFMELWIPEEAHKRINGLARKQSVQTNLQGAVFDFTPLENLKGGVCTIPYMERKLFLREALQKAETCFVANSLAVRPEKEGYFVNLANELKAHATNAYDGIIMRNTEAPWRPGAVKQGEVLRVKPGKTVDVLCIGQSAEQRATKLGGFLTVEYFGKPTDVGSGLNQKHLQGIMDGSLDFRGKVIEVECLGITPDGRLREPRFKSVRHDTKREEDK